MLNGNCSFKALWLLHQIILNFQTKLAKRRMGKNKDDWKFVLLTVNVLVGILSESTDKCACHVSFIVTLQARFVTDSR